MAKFKFKIGDKVRILDGSKIDDYTAGWYPHLAPYIGDVREIGEQFTRDGRNAYRLKATPFTWDERGLERVRENQIVIYKNGREVVAKDCGTKKTAKATCSPADTFDFATGAKLALARLLEPPKPEKKLNCRFVVVASAPGDGLSVGKIYEVKDGKFTPDWPAHLGIKFKAPMQGDLYTEQDLLAYVSHEGVWCGLPFASKPIKIVIIRE